MKRVLTALCALGFTVALIGCEASVKTTDPDHSSSSGSTYEKKTTTVQPDGDVVKTKTEVKKY